ncbi:MAG: cobalt-precorrin-5B (C(1))-methyltransferase, partial [Chloroflexota bacterium]
NTARHVQELIQAAGLTGFFDFLSQLVAQRSHDYVGRKLTIHTLLLDFDGTLLGRGLRAA